MTRGDRRLLVVLTVLSCAFLLAEAAGALSTDLLYFAPLLLLGLPLIGGRYVGEAAIERLAAGRQSARRRPVARRAARSSYGFTLVLPRGGRLIASSLAVRPPPLAASS